MAAKLSPVEIVDAKLRRKGSMLWKVCKTSRSAPIRWLQERGGAIPDRYFAAIMFASGELRAGITKSDLVA